MGRGLLPIGTGLQSLVRAAALARKSLSGMLPTLFTSWWQSALPSVDTRACLVVPYLEVYYDREVRLICLKSVIGVGGAWPSRSARPLWGVPSCCYSLWRSTDAPTKGSA